MPDDDQRLARAARPAEDALRGADVCIAFSKAGPGTIAPDCVAAMARDPIVFACANPVPEIWPWKAHAAGDANPDAYRTDRRTAAQPSMITPGLRMPFGSSVCLSRRISAISSGVRLDPRYARLATPMPCSADTEPDGGSAPYTISSMV